MGREARCYRCRPEHRADEFVRSFFDVNRHGCTPKPDHPASADACLYANQASARKTTKGLNVPEADLAPLLRCPLRMDRPLLQRCGVRHPIPSSDWACAAEMWRTVQRSECTGQI